MDIEQLLTLPEAAALAGYTPQLFRHYVIKGRVPVAYQRGRFKFFDKDIIKDWTPDVRKNGRPNNQEA